MKEIVRIFFELLADPDSALEKLISKRHPWYPVVAVAGLAAVIFAPILYFFGRYDFLETNAESIAGLAAILLATSLLFFLIAPPFLALFGTRFTTAEIATAFTYSISPLIPLVILYYAANYLLLGRQSGVLYVITGVRDAFDWLLPALPVLHVVGQILYVNVFFRTLASMRNLAPVYALMLAIMSAVPFYLSLAVVTHISGFLEPSLPRVIWRFLLLFLDAW